MPKKPAYTYHYVATEPSSSGRDPYKVQIRVDNRIADLGERIRLAELTCNCPGWTFKRGDTRTCDHVRRHKAALEQFKEAERQSLRERETLEAQPWLPEIRDNYGIPERVTVTVRDQGGMLALQWLDKKGHPQRVRINRRAGRAAALILSVLGRPESHFVHFDLNAWLAGHEVKPTRLAWAPGLDFTLHELADPSAERDRWDTVFGSAFFAQAIPAVLFGRLPADARARRTRFAELFAGYKPGDVVQVSWKESALDFEDTLTVAAFAARIGIQGDEGVLRRAVRLCGVQLAATHSHGWPQAPEGVSPYALRHYRIDDMAIGGVTLDTRRHLVFFWTNTAQLTRARRLYLDDRAFDFARNAQNLVHVHLSEEDGIEFHLDELNECPAECGEIRQMFQVTAEFVRRARLTELTQACGFDTDHNRLGVVPLDGSYPHAPELEAQALWRLTDPGRNLLGCVLNLEQLLNRPDLPSAAFLTEAARRIRAVLDLVPGCPPTPALAMRHVAQQSLRDWLGRLRNHLTDSRFTPVFGEGSPTIVPDWYAADLEHEAA